MSVTTIDPGFVKVAGELEPFGIAGAVAADAQNRVAEAVTWIPEETKGGRDDG